MDIAIDDILDRVAGHAFWLDYLEGARPPSGRVGVHLAIFAEPFLTLVLTGVKTTESRFSRNRCAPFGEVFDGDIILLKEVSGPICGLALAMRTEYYDLGAEPLDRIRDRYGAVICADEAFWEERRDAAYATVIELGKPTSIGALFCDKRDRRGWVALRSRQFVLPL